jgi:hypothetical protein
MICWWSRYGLYYRDGAEQQRRIAAQRNALETENKDGEFLFYGQHNAPPGKLQGEFSRHRRLQIGETSLYVLLTPDPYVDDRREFDVFRYKILWFVDA